VFGKSQKLIPLTKGRELILTDGGRSGRQAFLQVGGGVDFGFFFGAPFKEVWDSIL